MRKALVQMLEPGGQSIKQTKSLNLRGYILMGEKEKKQMKVY